MLSWMIQATQVWVLITVISLIVCITTGVARSAPPLVTVPERARVCMVENSGTVTQAIPTVIDGMTYYGCEECHAAIAADPDRYTFSHDPVTGEAVDKATAELLCVDGRILYFESDVTRSRFRSRLPPPVRSVGPE